MIKASPVELRKSLEAAHALAAIGIKFVPMPVLSDEDHHELVGEFDRRLKVILAEAEKSGGRTMNTGKQAFRPDGGEIGTDRLNEIANNVYGDEEKCWLARRVLALRSELAAAGVELEKSGARIAELEALTAPAEPAADNIAQQALAANTEPCVICGVVSSHPEGWHYCKGEPPIFTCPACGEQSYEDLGYGALRCADCGEHFTKAGSAEIDTAALQQEEK